MSIPLRVELKHLKSTTQPSLLSAPDYVMSAISNTTVIFPTINCQLNTG